MAPASYLATRVLQKLADDDGHLFPLGSRCITQDMYMDDLISGALNIADAVKLRQQITHLLQRGGMNIRKWASSEKAVIQDLQNSKDDPHLCVDLTKTYKTLGVHWLPEKDVIRSRVDQDTAKSVKITKRVMLSQIASLFDPFGLLGPVLVNGKLMMQQLWQLELSWDESLPLDLATKWIRYRTRLATLDSMEMERRVIINHLSGITMVKLLCSKSRIAPLKKSTIPRLELCATLLLSRLCEVVTQAMRTSWSKITLWTDSTIVLSWLSTSPHRLKTFVANRVAEIQQLTSNYEWRHVSSSENPADLISRGLDPAEISTLQDWHNGPLSLQLSEESWPMSTRHQEEIPELKRIVVLVARLEINWMEKYSSFRAHRRIVALCLRFLKLLKARNEVKGFLTAEELRMADIRIVKCIQAHTFTFYILREIEYLKKGSELPKTSPILSLSPFLDEHNVLRVGGCLDRADLPYDQKHQKILPSKNHVTILIIRDIHVNLKHASIMSTLCAI